MVFKDARSGLRGRSEPSQGSYEYAELISFCCP